MIPGLPNELELAKFDRQGFVVIKGLAEIAECDEIREVAELHAAQQLAPIEYELDVQYPGSPRDANAEGATTTRRLLQAYSRHERFRNWGANAKVTGILRQLFSDPDVELSQCHHNCVMTKQPGYSSATLWHQDNRYWAFDQQNLISVWLALGDENRSNGCLRVIPASHKIEIEPGRFDAALFLRPDLKENKALMAQSEQVVMDKGDVLFFHSRLFHAAGRNLTSVTKYSLVYTYHQMSNRPIKDTRSARFPSIDL